MVAFKKNAELMERAQAVIPGGMYGHQSVAKLSSSVPQFFAKADGSKLWDVDGNIYIDYLCGYGTNLLGYRNQQVDSAALAQQMLCDSMTGPAEVMVTLAETFVGMINHASWAMFCKNGSDATSMAVVCARAYRGKKKILVASGTYHGASHWNTPILQGITQEDRANVIYFRFNDPDSLQQAFVEAKGDVAGVFATPFRHEVFEDQVLAKAHYAQAARRLCDEHDALLVVDEVRTGFRLSRDCVWQMFGVEPDLSCWGKVIGNGYPISALLGSEKARQAAQAIFVTGSYWFSAVPMAACLATLNLIRTTDYLERISALAQQLRSGIGEQAQRYGFDLRQTGPVEMPLMLFAGDTDLQLGNAWTGAAMQKGVYLHPYHNMFLSSAHSADDIARTLEATEQAFIEIAKKRTL